MPALIDLTGKQFGKLTVLCRDKEYQKKHKKNNACWRCQCECGNQITVIGSLLTSGHTKSCGCLHKEISRNNGGWKDLTGKKFGKLTVVKEDKEYRIKNNIKARHCYWECKCECGNTISVLGNSLLSGATVSCGCHAKEVGKESALDLTGKRFGKLVALYRVENKDGKTQWLCQCDCGNTKVVKTEKLRSGNTISCGCILSKGELKILELLQKNNIIFEQQKIFNTCLSSRTKAPLRFDFYINNSFLLEYDGEQHYKYSEKGYFNKENFLYLQQKDKIKNEWCEKHGIPLKRIPYWELENITIENILDDTFLIKEK